MDDTFYMVDVPNVGLRVYDSAREARSANFFVAPTEITRKQLAKLYDERGDEIVLSDKALERYLGE